MESQDILYCLSP